MFGARGLQKARGPARRAKAQPKPAGPKPGPSPFMGGPGRGPKFRPGGSARRPAFNFFLKNNILYFYIYITNSFNKHKRNVAQLVRALKFKLEGRGSKIGRAHV